ncbi:hypothetical protein BDR04DRAFT_1112551 [Suillus decipiens]|nr:hypothetical protein BDR04DRAFT_1112551 [Suillus decipiens]
MGRPALCLQCSLVGWAFVYLLLRRMRVLETPGKHNANHRYPNLMLHSPACQSSMLYSPYLGIMYLSNSRTTFPKYIPKGKLANFLDSYAVDHEFIASTPAYDSSSARWTVEVQHGDQKVFLTPKHLVLTTGIGNPCIPAWDGIDKFQGALYHSEFHKDAEQF